MHCRVTIKEARRYAEMTLLLVKRRRKKDLDYALDDAVRRDHKWWADVARFLGYWVLRYHKTREQIEAEWNADVWSEGTFIGVQYLDEQRTAERVLQLCSASQDGWITLTGTDAQNLGF